MYKILPIGGKDYKLEYTVEASLYSDCITELREFLGKTSGAVVESEITENMNDEQKATVRSQLLKNVLSGMDNLPKTAITIFYAGLLEHHGEDGDRSVLSMKDAKNLVRQYFEDHAEDGTDNFYDLLLICMEQIGADGFFKRTGMEKALTEGNKKIKEPQDHKKKASGN